LFLCFFNLRISFSLTTFSLCWTKGSF
jgi:hypothetical protein